MTAITAWPSQAQDWLDHRGKAAWIAATILGFIFFWPAGLALLVYMIWSKRMFTGSCRHARHSQYHDRFRERMMYRHGMRSSGNTAFDAYRSETLRRLEEEQSAFESFLQRLRDAKDKTEFDAFMDDRARAARDEDQASGPQSDRTSDRTDDRPQRPGPEL